VSSTIDSRHAALRPNCFRRPRPPATTALRTAARQSACVTSLRPGIERKPQNRSLKITKVPARCAGHGVVELRAVAGGPVFRRRGPHLTQLHRVRRAAAAACRRPHQRRRQRQERLQILRHHRCGVLQSQGLLHFACTSPAFCVSPMAGLVKSIANDGISPLLQNKTPLLRSACC